MTGSVSTPLSTRCSEGSVIVFVLFFLFVRCQHSVLTVVAQATIQAASVYFVAALFAEVLLRLFVFELVFGVLSSSELRPLQDVLHSAVNHALNRNLKAVAFIAPIIQQASCVFVDHTVRLAVNNAFSKQEVHSATGVVAHAVVIEVVSKACCSPQHFASYSVAVAHRRDQLIAHLIKVCLVSALLVPVSVL